jgi:hypothetical protein
MPRSPRARPFRAARDLEQAAYTSDLTTFDDPSVDAKSFLGAVLDFIGVDRTLFAQCWHPVRHAPPAETVVTREAPAEERIAALRDDEQSADTNHADGKLL